MGKNEKEKIEKNLSSSDFGYKDLIKFSEKELAKKALKEELQMRSIEAKKK